MAIKVLIVDDSALVRQSFKQLLESDPEIEVIATARDPFVAAEKIAKMKPDVITLDIEMPKMDGITFLQKLMRQLPIPVLVISNQSVIGAELALKAIEYGAVDCISKPKLSTQMQWDESSVMLIDKVKSAYYAKNKNSNSAKKGGKEKRKWNALKPIINPSNFIIAIGASTGGTEAIREFLEALPPKMPPILIVQHMPEKFTKSFADRLNELCVLNVKEAQANEEVLPNTVYIAPGNFHMGIVLLNTKYYLQIKTGELVNRHRPSVNVLFDSVAKVCGKNSLGIILTGMGDDGALGLKKMYDKGAYTIAQDKASSVVFGMPNKAIQQKGVTSILSLEDIAPSVCNYIFEKD
jgi:two-component system chemotaxis response regulator CheB